MRNIFKALNISLLTLFLIAIFSSCKKDEIFPAPALGQDYFPVTIGSSIIYKVDSITWNDFYTPVRVDSFSFFIKFEIDSSFIDNQGRESFYWRKYYRTDSTSWQLVKNYSLTKTETRVESFEENIRYIKLTFPVSNTATWNMNALNTLSSTSSYYDEYDMPYQNGSFSSDSTLVIINRNQESLIGKDYHKEIYAKHIGLVNRQEISVEKETSGKWKKGYLYSYSIISYSN